MYCSLNIFVVQRVPEQCSSQCFEDISANQCNDFINLMSKIKRICLINLLYGDCITKTLSKVAFWTSLGREYYAVNTSVI